MNNLKWILTIIALFVSWVAVFYFGKSTVVIPEQIIASDSLNVLIDTVYIDVPYTEHQERIVEPDSTSLGDVSNPYKELVYSDSLSLPGGKVSHTLTINEDLTAKSVWDAFFLPIKGIEKHFLRTKTIVQEKIVLEELEFYENHWFYASVGSWILAILVALGGIL